MQRPHLQAQKFEAFLPRSAADIVAAADQGACSWGESAERSVRFVFHKLVADRSQTPTCGRRGMTISQGVAFEITSSRALRAAFCNSGLQDLTCRTDETLAESSC